MAWAYTIFENIKLFRSSEIMNQFYAVLMGKVSFGLGPTCYPQGNRKGFCPQHRMALPLLQTAY
jgi:hypothetical protein